MAIDLDKATNVNIEFVGKLKQQGFKITDEVSITIKDKTTLRLLLCIEQSLQRALDNYKALTVKRVTIESSGIVINYKGEDVIRLKRIMLSKGGTAEVKDYEALNTISYLEATESLIILISLLARTSSQFERYGVLRQEKNFEPTIIKGLTLAELNAKISEAVVSIIREKKNAIGGIDIEKAFGIRH